jgi:bacterioferritin (cytochrome b1)
VPEQLQLALDGERAAIERLNRGIALTVAKGDNGTRDLLAGILHGEEESADWLETQLGAIAEVGLPLYLAEQLKG